VRSLAVLLVLSAPVASCDAPPGQPTHLDAFRLAGPSEVAPGSSASFKALLDKSATLADVSDDAQWISSNPSVLSIDAGLATAHVAGEVTVRALFDEHETDAMPVLVLPTGTYRMRGRVVVAGSSAGVSMARVEVPAVGLSTTTDIQGRYALYGVPPDAELHVIKEGFATAVVPIHLQDHNRDVTTPLQPMLSGTYTLTISPGVCSNGPPVPANLLHRTYTAGFVQSGLQVQGSLAGPNLTVVSFSGSYSTTQGRWNLGVAIGERLPDGNAVTFNGSAFVRPADLAGEFNGRIALNSPSAPDALARCEASAFRFALTP
jgi:hypothetical protein